MLGIVQADPGDGDDPSGAVVGGSVTVKLTPQEMTARAEQMLDTMEQAQRRVIELQLLARNAKDIIKLNCVNDKFLQVKQLLNIADDAKAGVYAAGDDRDHAFAQITLSSEKVTGLRGEAEGCVGDGEMFVGSTRVSVKKPDILDDPTTVDPFNLTGFSIERPTLATPFL
jgi:hypothetical protein